MAMNHMAALSVSKGKHHVVEQGGKLSTPFSAFFSLITPGSVGTALRSSAPTQAVKDLVSALDAAETAGMSADDLAAQIASVDGMSWSNVETIRLGGGTVSGGDFTFSKAIAANLAQSKKGMGSAALDRARNQAVRDAIQDSGAALATDSWQLVHPSTPWSLLSVFAPAAATLSYPAVSCVLDMAAGELSGLFATRYETLSRTGDSVGRCARPCSKTSIVQRGWQYLTKRCLSSTATRDIFVPFQWTATGTYTGWDRSCCCQHWGRRWRGPVLRSLLKNIDDD